MNQLIDDIISTANSFTENFRDRGTFDYSVTSLYLVDELLEEMSDYDLDEDSIFNASSMIGCYVFETARKNFGGEYRWIKDEEQPVLIAGLPDFSVAIKAWEKVRGRIINGQEDNIPFYIDGFKEHIEKGKHQKGYSATII